MLYSWTLCSIVHQLLYFSLLKSKQKKSVHAILKNEGKIIQVLKLSLQTNLPSKNNCAGNSPVVQWLGSVLSWLRLQVWSLVRASLVAQKLKRLPTMPETQVWSLGLEDPLEKEMATHSSILAWRIPWTEEPGRLQSTGLQRFGHDWATSLSQRK